MNTPSSKTIQATENTSITSQTGLELKQKKLSENIRQRVEMRITMKWMLKCADSPNLIELLKPSEKKIIELRYLSETFATCDFSEFTQAILRCQMMLGVSPQSRLNDMDILLLKETLAEQFKSNTPDELLEACKLACAGQLDVNTNTYGAVSFKFVSEILQAYNKIKFTEANEALRRIVEESEAQNNTMSPLDKKQAIREAYLAWKKNGENPAAIPNLGGCIFDFCQNDFGWTWNASDKYRTIDEAAQYLKETKSFELASEAIPAEKRKIQGFIDSLVIDKTPAYSLAKSFLLHERFLKIDSVEKLDALLKIG